MKKRRITGILLALALILPLIAACPLKADAAGGPQYVGTLEELNEACAFDNVTVYVTNDISAHTTGVMLTIKGDNVTLDFQNYTFENTFVSSESSNHLISVKGKDTRISNVTLKGSNRYLTGIRFESESGDAFLSNIRNAGTMGCFVRAQSSNSATVRIMDSYYSQSPQSTASVITAYKNNLVILSRVDFTNGNPDSPYGECFYPVVRLRDTSRCIIESGSFNKRIHGQILEGDNPEYDTYGDYIFSYSYCRVDGNTVALSTDLSVYNTSDGVRYRIEGENLTVSDSNNPIFSAEAQIDAPVAGERPDFDAVLINNMFYDLNTSAGGAYKNGVAWYDRTTGTWVDGDDGSYFFIPGHSYRVYIYMTGSTGRFVYGFVPTINNQRAKYVLNASGAKSIAMHMDFDPLPQLIDEHPLPVNTKAGERVEMRVSTVASLGTRYYRWEYSKDGGNTWIQPSAASSITSTYTFKATNANDGWIYRCTVYDPSGNTEVSKWAMLNIVTGPIIYTEPNTQTAVAGQTVKMIVVAEGEGTLSYQWEYSKNDGVTWKVPTASSAKKAVYSFKATMSNNGWLYRCRVTDSIGTTVSLPAQLEVKETADKPEITKQPVSQTVKSGETVKMTVSAYGDGLTYQWQYSKDGGSTWKNPSASSAKTATYSFKATAANNGWKYRCRITASGGAYTDSNAVTLTVGLGPVITSQPKAQTVSASATVKMSVTAAGKSLTYQWQYSKDGGNTWKTPTASSAKTATYSFKATSSNNGWLYKCIITDIMGLKTESSQVKLTVK